MQHPATLKAGLYAGLAAALIAGSLEALSLLARSEFLFAFAAMFVTGCVALVVALVLYPLWARLSLPKVCSPLAIIAALCCQGINTFVYPEDYLLVHQLVTACGLIAYSFIASQLAHRLAKQPAMATMLIAAMAVVFIAAASLYLTLSQMSVRSALLQKGAHSQYLLLAALNNLGFLRTDIESMTTPVSSSDKTRQSTNRLVDTLQPKRINIHEGSATQPRPNIVWLTVDSLRWDQLRSRVDTPMPVLWELSQRGTLLRQSYSPSCATIPAMAATLSSRHTSEIGFREVAVTPTLSFVPSKGLKLSKRQATKVPTNMGHSIAKVLSRAGYRTLTVPSYVFYLREAGITVDFEVVHEAPFRARGLNGMGIVDLDIVGASSKLIGSTKDKARPYFLWLHFMDAHAPYLARDEASKGKDAFTRYQSELRHVDRQIDLLLRFIKRDDPSLKNTIIVVHADHGEEFGEHGGKFHATELYEETIRVPLVIYLPRQSQRDLLSKRESSQNTLLDIVPTLLAASGVPADGASYSGRNLLDKVSSQRAFYSTCQVHDHNKISAIGGRSKLLVDKLRGIAAYFDLEKDAAEQNNLIEDPNPQIESLFAVLHAAENRIWRDTAID